MQAAISYFTKDEAVKREGVAFLGENEEKVIVYEEPAAEGTLRYDVLDAAGELSSQGFAVLNNIAVTEEGRAVFEARFQNRARLIEKEPGFQAIRVLRPLTDDTYVIMTIWDNEDSFKGWQQSQAYEKAHQKRHTPAGIDQQTSIFPRPSFVSTFQLK